jgi:hypothetical protein
VPHEAEQRERGRRGGPLPELVRRQAGALGEQRLAVEVQPRLKHLALARDERDALAVSLRCCPRHAAKLDAAWRCLAIHFLVPPVTGCQGLDTPAGPRADSRGHGTVSARERITVGA